MLAFCIGGLFPAVYAADNELSPNAEMAQPDLEFLEFLGQFETDDGQWIDPGSLLSEEFEDLLNATENSSNPDTNGNNSDSPNNDNL